MRASTAKSKREKDNLNLLQNCTKNNKNKDFKSSQAKGTLHHFSVWNYEKVSLFVVLTLASTASAIVAECGSKHCCTVFREDLAGHSKFRYESPQNFGNMVVSLAKNLKNTSKCQHPILPLKCKLSKTKHLYQQKEQE